MTTSEALAIGLWVLGTAVGANVLISSARRAGAQVHRLRWRTWGALVGLQAIPLIVLARPPVLRDWLFYPVVLVLCGVALALGFLGRHKTR